MPAPSSSNALTLGRPLVDKNAFRPDTDPAVITSFELIHQTFVGMGWFSGAKDGDTQYLGVCAFDNGDGTHTLYGGNPTDPTNPTALSISGGATITVKDEGVTLGGSFTALDFVGAGVEATDAGAGLATITIAGGGGSTYTAGDGLALTGTEFTAVGYEAIVVDGNGISVDYDSTQGLGLTESGAAGKLLVKLGANLTFDGSGQITTDGVNAFSTIAVSGQSDVVADAIGDTLTLVAGSNMTITTNAAGDSITFASSGGGTVTAGNYIDVSGSTVSVDFTEVSGFTGDYVLGANAGGTDAVFATIATWLTKLGGWGTASYMSIGNGSGTPVWEADGVC